MNKILIVCGPTATGKTAVALALAKKFNGELLSADSRQVYKRMNIGTGKDLPVNSKFQNTNSKQRNTYGFYEIDGIKLFGYDLVEPTEEFSVGQYIEIAKTIISDMWERGKLPILVGGTGFYIKGVIDGIETAHIGKDVPLREQLKSKSVDELFAQLHLLDSKKAQSLNDSDRKNPARLIRAIEIATWRQEALLRQSVQKEERPIVSKNTLFIGLKLEKELLQERIDARVEKRLEEGFEEELENLILEGITWDHQSMKALGYREWRTFYDETKTREEVITEWKLDEKQYAKRQMTWFEKEKRIQWFDVTEEEYPENVVKTVKIWNTNN